MLMDQDIWSEALDAISKLEPDLKVNKKIIKGDQEVIYFKCRVKSCDVTAVKKFDVLRVNGNHNHDRGRERIKDFFITKTVKKDNNRTRYLKCRNKNCNAKAIDRNGVLTYKGEHNHPEVLNEPHNIDELCETQVSIELDSAWDTNDSTTTKIGVCDVNVNSFNSSQNAYLLNIFAVIKTIKGDNYTTTYLKCKTKGCLAMLIERNGVLIHKGEHNHEDEVKSLNNLLPEDAFEIYDCIDVYGDEENEREQQAAVDTIEFLTQEEVVDEREAIKIEILDVETITNDE